MGKIDINKQLKENSLLKTAFEFFTTKGFSKTSISDIVSKAGVAKGTFYLYFKDKYDIRNRLIAHKSSQIFRTALDETKEIRQSLPFDDRIIAVIDNIIDQLTENQSLMTFISKNLSWGIFKSALITSKDEGVNFLDIYYELIEEAPFEFKNPEIMLFMIIELVSGVCYSSILHEEPCNINEMKPYLYNSIKAIINQNKFDEKQ